MDDKTISNQLLLRLHDELCNKNKFLLNLEEYLFGQSKKTEQVIESLGDGFIPFNGLSGHIEDGLIKFHPELETIVRDAGLGYSLNATRNTNSRFTEITSPSFHFILARKKDSKWVKADYARHLAKSNKALEPIQHDLFETLLSEKKDEHDLEAKLFGVFTWDNRKLELVFPTASNLKCALFNFTLIEIVNYQKEKTTSKIPLSKLKKHIQISQDE